MVLPICLVDDQINQVALLSVSPHSGGGCEGSPLGRLLFQVWRTQQERGQTRSRAHGAYMIEGRGKPTNEVILDSDRCMSK